MNRQQIEAAVRRGGPFTLRTADGKEYSVPHPDYISIAPQGGCVIVWDDAGRFHVLPLLTMTGLESKSPDAHEENPG